MAMTTQERTGRSWSADHELLMCPGCHGSLHGGEGALVCGGCSTAYPLQDGVLVVKAEPTADNKIAADFYNSKMWPKFRFWEKFFWVCNGGERKSRQEVLKHLPTEPGLRLLDIAIGDGMYTGWLPESWSVVGLDVSTAQLAACLKRNGERDLRLALGEAESLPFQDHSFDTVLSIGGFNHFNDPEKALREMVRVAKPGAKVVVADELPDLTNRMLGHRIGLPGIDRWVVSKLMKLGDDFTDLVERHRDIDIPAMGERVLKNSQYEMIWMKGATSSTARPPKPERVLHDSPPYEGGAGGGRSGRGDRIDPPQSPLRKGGRKSGDGRMVRRSQPPPAIPKDGPTDRCDS